MRAKASARAKMLVMVAGLKMLPHGGGSRCARWCSGLNIGESTGGFADQPFVPEGAIAGGGVVPLPLPLALALGWDSNSAALPGFQQQISVFRPPCRDFGLRMLSYFCASSKRHHSCDLYFGRNRFSLEFYDFFKKLFLDPRFV